MGRLPDRQPVALSRLLQALVVLATTGACSESEPEPDFLWRGEHLDIHGYGVQASDYCGGTFTRIDAHMGEVATLFGYEGPRPVLSIGPVEFFEEHCPAGMSGCASVTNAFILDDRVPLDHELVHVANEPTTPCPKPLAEGLAEYYSTSYTQHGIPTAEIGLALADSLGPAGVLRGEHYPLMGHFVAFLIETRDLEHVLDACRLMDPMAEMNEFEAAMELAFGLSLDQLLNEYQSEYPVCGARETSRKLIECDRPLDAILDVGESVVLDYEIDCTNTQTLGPRIVQGEPNQVWVNRRVRLEPWLYPHVIRLRAESRANGEGVPAVVTFLPCERCIDGIQGREIELPEGVSLGPLPSVRAGEYVVEVRQPLDEAVPLVLTIESLTD